MPALVGAIVALIGVLATAVALFTPEGRKGMSIFLSNVIHAVIDIATPLVNELPASLQPIVQAFSDAFKQHGGSISAVLEQPFADLAKASFSTVADPLIARGPIDPSQWKDNAGELMGDAFGFGFKSWATSLAFESILPEKLNVLNGAGPMLATMAGFAEVTGAALGPLLNAAIKQPATYDVNSKLRPLLPDLARAQELYARRLITKDQLDALLAFAGMNPNWMAALEQIAFRPLQPRALAQAIGAHNFDRTALTHAMQYAGLRDGDIDLFIDAMIQRGLEPLRKGVLDETIKLAGEGLLSDSDVASTLDAQNLTDDAKNLINQHIALLRLHTMATLTRTEAVNAAKNQLITLDQLATDLSAVGYLDPEVAIIRDSVQQYLTAKGVREAARLLSQEEMRVQQITIREAQQSYKRGEIDEGTFAAELLAAGVPVERQAALLGLAAVLNQPTLKPGVKLSAVAMKQQSAKLAIKAIEEEFKKGAIDAATLRAGLIANGMSSNDTEATINYLVALGSKASGRPATSPISATNGTAPTA